MYDPNDYEPHHDDYEQQPGQRRGGMRLAAMVMGVLSVITCMMIYVSVPLGALAILFALLSRGRGRQLGNAKPALIMGVAGILASSILTGYALYSYYHDPVLHAQVNQLIERYRRVYFNGEDLLDMVSGDGDQEGATEKESEQDIPAGMDHDSLMEYYLKPHNDSGAGSADGIMKDPGAGSLDGQADDPGRQDTPIPDYILNDGRIPEGKSA